MNVAEKKKEILLVLRASGVALAIFDSPGRYNTLGRNAINELTAIVHRTKTDDSIKALVLISGKPESFIIGADLQEIRKASGVEELLALSENGHSLLNTIPAIGKPVLAGIHGPCLGGGLELALACHARIATDADETIFGLPETTLGIIPGLGGTQRLPRIAGLKAAMELILSGETFTTERALELGILDRIAEPDHLIDECERLALELLAGNDWTNMLCSTEPLPEANAASDSIKATRFCKTGLDQTQATKLLSITERAVRLKTKGNYPAQTRVLQVIKEGLLQGMDKGLSMEAQAFSELAASETAANLISLSMNIEIAKQQAFSLSSKYPDNEVATVAIIGAGKMGCSLALLSAAQGIQVLLSTSADKTDELQERIKTMAQKASHRFSKHLGPEDLKNAVDDLVSSIEIVNDTSRLAEADLILECVKEDSAIKSAVLAKCDQARRAGSVIASNTSGLSIHSLSQSIKEKEDFLGIHFFHPVERMPLVELVSHDQTSKRSIAMATDFIASLNKTALVVKDGPGFLINRLLTAYLVEFARMMDEAPLNWTESAAVDFGMPIGPMQLMDEVGIDVAFSVARNLFEQFGERLKLPRTFYGVSDLGVLGKKDNVGFYIWENDKPKEINPTMVSELGLSVTSEPCPPEKKLLLSERLILIMIDEAARCLEDRTVSRPREIDLAVVLGIGFPAFRGGLLRYADKLGMEFICEKLDYWYGQSDCPRTVSNLLRKYKDQGRNFYSLSGS